MATTLNNNVTRLALTEGERFNIMERYVLRRSHPFLLTFAIVASMWALYYLWLGEWRIALGILIVERLFSMTFLQTVNYRSMADTALGRMALLHLHPVNLVVQIVGVAFLIWGVWIHHTETIFGGISALILGHAFGWSKVNEHFHRTDIGHR